MDQALKLGENEYKLVETVGYPNGGKSLLYSDGEDAIILDDGICRREGNEPPFEYMQITDKQNACMKKYRRVYRFLTEDKDKIEDVVTGDREVFVRRPDDKKRGAPDRSEGSDSSPLEFHFEKKFADVYGPEALKFLHKEYKITDSNGNPFFLDYLVHTKDGSIAVEENGVTYHHPQLIGPDAYRRQLTKQNCCAKWGIRLFRFSSEDCRFEPRIEDDIISFFGNDTRAFVADGLAADRTFKLYEHQALTLAEMEEARDKGIRTFLAVLPTASGKSQIALEDMKRYLADHPKARALITAPTRRVVEDWEERCGRALGSFSERIEIRTNAWMAINYARYAPDHFSYVVVDEAHHAVADGMQRVIRHLTPDFMIGLTATDDRPDKKRLEPIFGTYRTHLSLAEAMEKKIVAEANVYRIETNLDLTEVRFNGKDYVNADLEKHIRVKSRNELIADVLREYFSEGPAGERQGVVFCVNISHCREMEKVLRAAGISAAAYTGGSSETDAVMEAFRAKKIRFLCACNMVSEGWDYPELGILVMARPTMSKVLYLQQIGRGLRRTSTKEHVFVIDVVDEYGAAVKPFTMHAIFKNSVYVPFGSILKRDYHVGDMVEVDGLVERVERIVQVDTETFAEKYGDYLNQEQTARELFMSTGSIMSWIKKGRIVPDAEFPFGSKKIYLFSPGTVRKIKTDNNIPDHNDETIRKDFFDFLHERDYSLSYKMPFLLAFLKHMNSIGEAKIDDVLADYIAFYQDRVDKGLPVDRKTCPYTAETLRDKKFIQRNMLTNPFEKFERKRFMYYSKELGVIAMNHALAGELSREDVEEVRRQMGEDLENYYRSIEDGK